MAANDVQADGYYAEDDMGKDELDLSFLDDGSDKPDETGKTAAPDSAPDKK